MERTYFKATDIHANQETRSKVFALSASENASVTAQYRNGTSLLVALTAFGEIPDVITVDWCKEFAAIAETMTGEKIERVNVRIGEKNARYTVSKNHLILWDEHGAFYENNNGVICKDRALLPKYVD